MAKVGNDGSDPLLTIDVVREFMLSRGGKIQNHELVAHFKNFLNDPIRKGPNRQKIKVFVNTLAVVKLDPSGEKVLSLKKKYRDSENCGDDQTPSSAPVKPDFVVETTKETSTADNPKTKNTDKKSQSCDDLTQKTVEFEGKEDYVLISKNESKSLERLDDEELPKEPFVSPTCSQEFEVPQMNVISPVDEEPLIEEQKTTETEAVKPEKPKDLPLLERTDERDGTRQLFEQVTTPKLKSVTPIAEEPTSAGLSVKDVARNINKLETESQSQSRPLGQKNKRESRKPTSNDDGNGDYTMTFTELDREWLMASANCDYMVMMKMLQTDPQLARKRDFITGYAPLHWAAKHGNEDVIKLLCKHDAVVNVRTHGGYTPLHLAAMQNHEAVVQLLVHGYSADTNMRDYSGKKAKECMHRSASAHMRSLLQTRRMPQILPTPESPIAYDSAIGKAMLLGINAVGGMQRMTAASGKENAPLPRPTSKGDNELMPPPHELPPVQRKAKPVARQKDVHSDSEMSNEMMEQTLHGSGSSPNFGSIV